MKKLIIAIIAVIFCCCNYVLVFGDESNDEYIVVFSENRQNELEMLSLDFELQEVSESLNIYTTTKENAERLYSEGLLKFMEKNAPIELIEADMDYNDEYFSKQWEFEAMNIIKAQKSTLEGENVRVAIIDSGVNVHSDFDSTKIEAGYNYVNPQNDTSDLENHGTRVAGVICSQGNNGIGTVGVAPKVTIVPLVVYQGGGSIANTIKAIDDAVDKYNCKILNMSIGSKYESSALQLAIDNAVSKGAIIIASVGNVGDSVVLYPSGCDNVIGVGAISSNFEVASFSQKNNTVDITAAGRGLCLPNNTGGYTLYSSGTSFSAPMVSGFAALMASKYPNITNDEFLNCLKIGSKDGGEIGYDINYGYGILDMYESLLAYENTQKAYISPVFINNNSYNLKFYSSEVQSGTVVFAVYNESRLVYCKKEKIDFNDSFAAVKITPDYAFEGTETIKILLLDNLDNIIPLARYKALYIK